MASTSGPGLLYEGLATLIFQISMNAIGVLAILAAPYAPEAKPFELVLAFVMGFLTLFSFLLPGAFLNPVGTIIAFFAGRLRPARFLALVAVELAATVAAIALVAEALVRHPVAGAGPPAPPSRADDKHAVLGVEFGLTLLNFGAGGVLSRALGPLLAPFASSALYVACAYYEAGRFSGSVVNPAAVLALHVYRGPLTEADTWVKGARESAPYLLGITAAAIALGIAQRPREAKAKTA